MRKRWIRFIVFMAVSAFMFFILHSFDEVQTFSRIMKDAASSVIISLVMVYSPAWIQKWVPSNPTQKPPAKGRH